MNLQEFEEEQRKKEEVKRLIQERENALSFHDYLSEKYYQVDRLSHSDNLHTAIDKAEKLIEGIISRYMIETKTDRNNYKSLPEGKELYYAEQTLRGYKYNSNNSSQRAIINEFRKDLLLELSVMISKRKPTTDTTPEDDKV